MPRKNWSSTHLKRIENSDPIVSREIIAHSRRTKREGLFALVGGVATTAILVGGIELFGGWIRKEDPFFYFVFIGLGLIIGGLVVFGYAMPNLLMNREFRFVLYEDRIECHSPAKAYGETNCIAIDEIASLEEDPTGDSTYWFIATRDNRRIKITPNYGNPVRKIVAALRELRPELPVRRI
jgi:hypothetical protein